MSHISWPSISNFHTVRRGLKKFPHLLNGSQVISYRPKIKLHGTNAGIQIRKNDVVIAQSRKKFITPGDDNAGFAAWVETNRKHFSDCWDHQDMVVFGEWCGPGIMKGVGVNNLPKKMFAIFGITLINDKNQLIVEPEILRKLLNPALSQLDDCIVIDWFCDTLQVDILSDPVTLEAFVQKVNKDVELVEKQCPFAKEYGAEGTGEGLVYYPRSPEHLGRENFKNICFKAKGEKHKVVATKKAVQIDPEVARSVDEFVKLFVTDARCEQGAREVQRNSELEFNPRLIGPFIGWMSKDIKKESKAELEAANLTWRDVVKKVSSCSREWYLQQIRSIN